MRRFDPRHPEERRCAANKGTSVSKQVRDIYAHAGATRQENRRKQLPRSYAATADLRSRCGTETCAADGSGGGTAPCATERVAALHSCTAKRLIPIRYT